MKSGRKLFGLLITAVCAVLVSEARAALIKVTTNMNGADAEIREEEVNADLFGVPQGSNRGTNSELATRVKDATANPQGSGGDRTSSMYLKFDISNSNGITNQILNARGRTNLRLTVRNANQIRWGEVRNLKPYYGSLPANTSNPDWVAFSGADPVTGVAPQTSHPNWVQSVFNVYGLKNFSHANYNWLESGAGSLTWYNAPGITPDPDVDAGTSGYQNDAGKFNYNSDMDLLGTFILPNPPPFINNGGTALAVGSPVDFIDEDGKLHDLIEMARMNGKTHITLAVSIANNGFLNATGETAQTTPSAFINRNYLFNPKEMDSATGTAGLQLSNDTVYDPDGVNIDPDGAGPMTAPPNNPPTGSPYSCLSATVCPGMTLGDNTGGAFSPQLLFIPEPASLTLLALGSLLVAGLARRRRK